jgi:hypothetical protein
VDENRIVYDWFHPAGKLHLKSRGTPKEEWSRTASSSASPPTDEPVALALSATTAMAHRFYHCQRACWAHCQRR